MALVCDTRTGHLRARIAMNPPSTLVTLGIPVLALVVVAAAVVAVARTAPRGVAISFAVGVAAWLGLAGVLAATGFYADWDARPPRGLFLMAPTILLPVIVGVSAIGRRLAERLPLAALIGFHAFRLPLELVMHRAAAEGTMPPQMTFTGANFDIVTGALALAILVVYRGRTCPRPVAHVFSIVGSALLVVIGGIAVVSLPTFALFGRDPAHLNTWVASFPFVWLPAGLFASAVLGHVVLWRRLLSHTAPPSDDLRPPQLGSD